MCVHGDSDISCVPKQYSSNYKPSSAFLDDLQPRIWLKYIFYLIRNNLKVVLDTVPVNKKYIDWVGYLYSSNIRKELVFVSNYVAELTEKMKVTQHYWVAVWLSQLIYYDSLKLMANKT